ncbi:HAD-IIIA family hydrolase [Candidatus Parcubacteria bacterium]|nr:MAG: HAD-IIIA family hydrolase [Candidatus Parcubacteria bacterium]
MGVRALDKRRAVFLDRDGTIIRQVELLTRISKVKILPGAARAIRELNSLGFLIIVASNQPVVARGLISPRGIERMNRVLEERLLRFGARIDKFYFCPHHPKATLKKYRVRCGCRKPGAGMIRRGMKEHRISPRGSFMVGDGVIDVVAGKRAKLMTILVKSGPGHSRLDKMYNVKPDFVAKNLPGAVRIIKRHAK